MEQRSLDAPSAGGRQLASQAAAKIKNRLEHLTEERKSRATGALEAIGRTLRTASGNLQEEGLDPVARLGVQAAEKVDRMADYRRRCDLDSLRSDVRGAARQHPEAFLGGALLCGILLGRFLRSSAPSNDEGALEPDVQRERAPQGDWA